MAADDKTNETTSAVPLTPDFFGICGVRGPLHDVLRSTELDAQSVVAPYGLYWCREGG